MTSEGGDTEEKRYIDRIRAIAWKEARDAGAKFIDKKWIANKLNRSEDWIKDNWNKTYDKCKANYGKGRPRQLTPEVLQKIKLVFDENPKISLGEAAIKLCMSKESLRRAVKELNITLYAKLGREALSDLIKKGVRAAEERRGKPQRRSGGRKYHRDYKSKKKTEGNCDILITENDKINVINTTNHMVMMNPELCDSNNPSTSSQIQTSFGFSDFLQQHEHGLT